MIVENFSGISVNLQAVLIWKNMMENILKKLVQLGRPRLLHPTQTGADWLGSSTGGEDPVSQEDEMSQYCAFQQRMLALLTGTS